MGIRQTLNENPVITGAVCGGIILIALIAIVWQWVGCGNSGGGPPISTKQYFTIDDGKSYFADDGAKIPPFPHEGKTAVRAKLFKCGDEQPKVNHLERYSPEDQKAMQDILNKSGAKGANLMTMEYMGIQKVQVKKPGTPKWVKMTPNDPASVDKYRQIVTPNCDPGKPLVMVLPEG